MGVAAVNGATCQCMMGSATCSLTVNSQTTCLVEGKPVGTIFDSKAGVNLTGFGQCISLLNPAVAAATAAAFGVLTPQPCTFMAPGPWIPGNPKVLVGGKPVLSTDASLLCGIGFSSIKVVSPGQNKMIV